MEYIKYEKASGEGVDALYNLYIYDELIASGITIDEVMEKINAYEGAANE